MQSPLEKLSITAIFLSWNTQMHQVFDISNVEFSS